jgi:hypothetical protein
VNNDGYADVILGSHMGIYFGGAGAAYVIFGMASGFANVDLASFISSDSTGYIIQGAMRTGQVGKSVSGAGDINGDGFDDVIVGAPRTEPFGAGRTQAGAAYVIFGKAAGFTTLAIVNFTSSPSTGYIIQGAIEYAKLGMAVAGAGTYVIIIGVVSVYIWYNCVYCCDTCYICMTT